MSCFPADMTMRSGDSRASSSFDPNLRFAHGMLSAAYAFGGEAELAIDRRKRRYGSARAISRTSSGTSRAPGRISVPAVRKGRRARGGPRIGIRHSPTRTGCCLALGHLGRMAEARAASTCYRPHSRQSGRSAFGPAVPPPGRPGAIFAGLHKAGLPEQRITDVRP